MLNHKWLSCAEIMLLCCIYLCLYSCIFIYVCVYFSESVQYDSFPFECILYLGNLFVVGPRFGVYTKPNERFVCSWTCSVCTLNFTGINFAILEFLVECSYV